MVNFKTIGKIAFVVLCGLLLRYSVALNSHSGQGKPPMFGDFEAQRHWMEVTVHLPVQEWYHPSKFNDLLYWGLDYPPLTAYHSWVMGKIAQNVNTSFVAPYTSRGLESQDVKTFMRYTVLFSDLLFIAACVSYFYSINKGNRSQMASQLFLALTYPSLILIDHGHFQYNSVSLGLTVLAVTLLFNNSLLIASICFSMAVNYKQMSLYHSLPFFIYILAKCLSQKTKPGAFWLLTKVALVVILSFLCIWAPYLRSIQLVNEVLARIFPVARGIFEDKVGNIWCAINVVYKLREHFTPSSLALLCTVCTLVSVSPSLYLLARYSSHRQFLLSLVNVSLGFFLFSFQVHEKSILLVALPVILYSYQDMLPCCWFLSVSHVSLLHLSLKDNLIIPHISLSVIFYSYLFMNSKLFLDEKKSWKWVLMITPSFLGSIGLLFGFLYITPPVRYPDIWPLLNALYSCGHFIGFFVYFNYTQISTAMRPGLKTEHAIELEDEPKLNSTVPAKSKQKVPSGSKTRPS